MGLESHNKENKDNLEIRTSRGDFDLARGDISGAIQEFVREGDINGLQKVATELYRQGRDEEAQEVLKKTYEISSKVDK